MRVADFINRAGRCFHLAVEWGMVEWREGKGKGARSFSRDGSKSTKRAFGGFVWKIREEGRGERVC